MKNFRLIINTNKNTSEVPFCFYSFFISNELRIKHYSILNLKSIIAKLAIKSKMQTTTKWQCPLNTTSLFFFAFFFCVVFSLEFLPAYYLSKFRSPLNPARKTPLTTQAISFFFFISVVFILSASLCCVVSLKLAIRSTPTLTDQLSGLHFKFCFVLVPLSWPSDVGSVLTWAAEIASSQLHFPFLSFRVFIRFCKVGKVTTWLSRTSHFAYRDSGETL